MKKELQLFKDLGAKELRVANKEATVFNHHKKGTEEWVHFDFHTRSLSSFPCGDIEDGIYPIERFESEIQFKAGGIWVKAIEGYNPVGAREVLILKEQAEETQLDGDVEHSREEYRKYIEFKRQQD